jgi:hypothetical protein
MEEFPKPDVEDRDRGSLGSNSRTGIWTLKVSLAQDIEFSGALCLRTKQLDSRTEGTGRPRTQPLIFQVGYEAQAS